MTNVIIVFNIVVFYVNGYIVLGTTEVILQQC